MSDIILPAPTPERPEILAPAGDAQCFTAALAAGADAVYLGLKHFSARMQAENFGLTDLSRLTDLAHEEQARVYVAMNVLVKPQETAAAYRLIHRLARQVRPDGIIVQDLAMLDLAGIPFYSKDRDDRWPLIVAGGPCACNVEPIADFFDVVAWRQLADVCGKYLAKGRKVAVVGELQTRTYDAKDGTKRYVTEIIADDVEFLTPRNQDGGEGGFGGGYGGGRHQAPAAPAADGFADIEDDELPF